MADLTAQDFRRLVLQLHGMGYGSDVEWQEAAGPPKTAQEFAREAIFVVCNSGMKHTVAQGIFDRVMRAVQANRPASAVFGHQGKAAAIDTIWQNRQALWAGYLDADDKLEFCAALPWIGQITKYHLAKNFGAPVAKPDVHLQRLADAEGVTPQQLCERLAVQTGYKIATVDVVLWRACAVGLIQPRANRTVPCHG